MTHSVYTGPLCENISLSKTTWALNIKFHVYNFVVKENNENLTLIPTAVHHGVDNLYSYLLSKERIAVFDFPKAILLIHFYNFFLF